MPWKETCPVHERLRFMAAVDRGEESVAGLARAFGVSRKTAYKWIERYREESVDGLRDRSRAPLMHPNAVPPDVVEIVTEARRKHPTWGPRKLLAWLGERHPEIDFPAASTCGDMLKRLGLVEPRRRRRGISATTSNKSVGYPAPNAVWCADFKGQFRTLDGTLCFPLTISDGHSRFLVRCQALTSNRGAEARPVFEAAFREHGLPDSILTDNGPPFATARGLHGLSRLSVWWLRLGIWIERIEPGHPEQNGRHERMHRTLKRETAYPPRATLAAQQEAFDAFRAEYNEERPHEALEQTPPASIYSSSTRIYPETLGDPAYPAHFEQRRVLSNGAIWWRDRQLCLSKALAGELVALEPVDEDLWSLHFGPTELATVDGREAPVRLVPHAAGPQAWPLAWWLAPVTNDDGDEEAGVASAATSSEVVG